MKWIKDFNKFRKINESNASNNSNYIKMICVSMVLLNNEFLDNLLDRGIKNRYVENSNVFITDLKNLLLAKNRLVIGKFVDDKWMISDNTSLINKIFDNINFNIETDWNVLKDSRNIARNIIDKLIVNEKLNSDDISYVYLNLDIEKEQDEDIILETKDGNQYGFIINKDLSTSKTSSFNVLLDDLIGNESERLFGEEYIDKWNLLTTNWVDLIYKNSVKSVQRNIEKFININDIDKITYFDYFNISNKDPKFKYLGEYFKEYDKNITKFSDLMIEIWKNKETSFMNPQRISEKWAETKIVILNSKILENLITTSMKKTNLDEIEVLEDGWKLSNGKLKMKLFKMIVEKMGCLERPLYYLGKKGDSFNLVPSRVFFRENYDDFDIKFDYHVNFKLSNEEDKNDFCIRIELDMDKTKLIDLSIFVKITSEMSGKLSSKYKFDIGDDFNYKILQKSNNDNEESEEM
jgi:hypothetical protein